MARWSQSARIGARRWSLAASRTAASAAPLIPHYDLFVWNDCLREIGQVRLPCNFVQIMENSVDPHHVEWLHGRFAAYARGDGATALFTQHAVKIGFDNFEDGIIKRRLVER